MKFADKLYVAVLSIWQNAYKLWIDPTPQDVTLKGVKVDANGNVSDVTIPNLAKSKKQMEEWKGTVFKTDSTPQLQRYMGKIGYQVNNRKIVIPLVELTDGRGSRKSAWSYTSGHFEWIRTNGCCSSLGATLSIKAMKLYDSEIMQVNTLEGGDNTNIKLVTFDFAGKKWGGLEVYLDAQSKYTIFTGFSTEELKVIPYFDIQNEISLNDEINNSLVFL